MTKWERRFKTFRRNLRSLEWSAKGKRIHLQVHSAASTSDPSYSSKTPSSLIKILRAHSKVTTCFIDQCRSSSLILLWNSLVMPNSSKLSFRTALRWIISLSWLKMTISYSSAAIHLNFQIFFLYWKTITTHISRTIARRMCMRLKVWQSGEKPPN